VAEYPRSGDDVHRVLAAQPGLARLIRHEEPDFLAEVYIRTEGTPVSVAHALLAAATEAGCAVLQAGDIAVETSARRQARLGDRPARPPGARIQR